MENIQDLYTDYLLSSFGQLTMIEKPFSKVDEHNCYHYDHSKGINLLNCLYFSESERGHVRTPINYHLVAKTLYYCEIGTKKEKRRAEVTKNELFRDMVGLIVRNQLPFRYVLADSWFCSNDNMRSVQKKVSTSSSRSSSTAWPAATARKS